MKTAIFPGSFDPFTRGHESVVRRGLGLFDRIIVAVGTNTTKSYYFSTEQRIEMISKTFQGESGVEVASFDGLTVDFCKDNDIHFILRGLRDGKDFFYEKNIALMNHSLEQGVQTVFLLTDPEHAWISSTIIREILRNDGDVSPFLPDGMVID